ncbi:hypothetical protein TR51_25705 [Kitasatospora griseola]|uniref:Uncharacterized protein n=1 Tax=Kitasatospora griseola TaxID=2064 RepID=A0A0D0N2Y5_KITGR|nr:hypothetical protein TR51_35560 [Kitasatospora griseola]KIQ62435.1 hypothetical protein TR51_25705 [Kitasatospora griseola]
MNPMGYEQVSGKASEVVKALETASTGWWHLGSDRKADRALKAAQAVRDGAQSVTVGRVVYTVTDALPEQRVSGQEVGTNAAP